MNLCFCSVLMYLLGNGILGVFVATKQWPKMMNNL